jgi:integrase
MEDRYGRDDGITFHSFRHTFATRCAAAGVPLRTLQEWLGHRDYKTVLIYADSSPTTAARRTSSSAPSRRASIRASI